METRLTMISTFENAVKKTFALLALATMAMIAESPSAGSDTLQPYHVVLAAKYGYDVLDLTVTRETRPDRLALIDQISDRTRRQLVSFATSIDAEVFTYKTNGTYWRMNHGDRILGYTYSIDILKSEVKRAGYHCFAVLDYRKGEGYIVDCAAYDLAQG